MYIKVTGGGVHADFLCKITPPIHFDFVAAELGENAEWDSEGVLVNPGDADFNKALNAHIEFMHLLEVDPTQTKYEKEKGLFAFRYVWWLDPETGLTAVITTRKVFIIGEDGKTIDRVR